MSLVSLRSINWSYFQPIWIEKSLKNVKISGFWGLGPFGPYLGPILGPKGCFGAEDALTSTHIHNRLLCQDEDSLPEDMPGFAQANKNKFQYFQGP